MRLLSLFALILLAANAATAQANASPLSATPDDEFIRATIESSAIDGHLYKIAPRMGDAAAVSITRAIAGDVPSRSQIETSLLILNDAFIDVSIVQNIPDRSPRTALLLLRYFETVTTDTKLHEQIESTRERILEKTKSAAGAPPK